MSVCKHALPSLHAEPSDRFGFEHVPVLGLQVPAAWHGSLAVHVTGLPPVQVPLWQPSVRVHALASLHVVPLAAAGFEHVPLAGLQVPATWHASLATHTVIRPGMHDPSWQVPPAAQALLSLHGVPLGADGLEQAPVLALQVPAT